MPQTLLDWLIAAYPTAKRQTFKRMLESDRLRVNGRKPKSLKVELAESDRVTVDAKQTPEPARLPFPIVFEDAELMVINKPAGLLTSTVPKEPRPTVLAAVRAYMETNHPKARVGLIHRLDRDASGLLVLSKSDMAYQSLKTQFFKHTVNRVYLAIVHGKPKQPAGRIESRLIELADGTVRTTRHGAKGQLAITDYQTITELDGMTALRVTLQTGRKHQIRTHLANMGTPIVNDPIYGDKPTDGPSTSLRTGLLMLAAVELGLDHPRTGKRAEFRIDPPPHMKLITDGPATS